MKQYIETNPKESTLYPGYYHTNFSPDIVLTPYGEFISLDSKEAIKVTYNSDIYPVIHVPKIGTRTVHRIMGETFLRCPGDFKDYQINHKNGIKTEFSLSNLEWASPSEDLIHAFKNGLRTDNRPTLAKDLETGEVYKFHGQNECARFLNTTSSHIGYFLKIKIKKYPFKERWDIIREGSEWNDLTREDVGKTSRPSMKMIITVSMDWKELTLYESIVHVADDYTVSVDRAKKWLAEGKSNLDEPFLLYGASDFRLIEDHNEYLAQIITKDYKNKRKKDKSTYIKNIPTPVVVTDLDTDEVKDYLSVDEFSKTVGVMHKTIQKSMWRKKGIWKHYYIEYQSNSK